MQQTRIDQGLKYWNTFINTWTDVRALAEAPLDDVLKAWQGLGYYSRARNLHRAAQTIAFERGSVFPATAAEWRTIPGVGPYTAAAIASICFNEPIASVDGNVLRVISRYRDIQDPIDRPIGRNQVEAFATEWIHPTEAGTHNQAVMELGALICKPTSPRCTECPLEPTCLNAQLDSGGTPVPPVKQGKTKVKSVQLVFHVVTNGSHVWMRQRPATGIWGGLWEFPSQEQSLESELPAAPLPESNLRRLPSEAAANGGTLRAHPIAPTASMPLRHLVHRWGARPQRRGLDALVRSRVKARPRAIDRCWERLENPARHWAIHSTALHTFEGWQELIKQS